MHADAHFERGRTHAVCQDYALAGHDDRGAWAAVCDGCSSSPGSDVGARLLAHAAAASLREGRLPGSRAVWLSARAAADAVGLAATALDATVVAACEHRDRVIAIIRGDGIVAARRRDGAVEVMLRRCRDETPDYPSVVADPDRRARWLALAEPRAWIEHHCGHATPPLPIRGHVWVGSFSKATYDRVLVASDGLATLRRPEHPEALDVVDVASRVLAAPSTTGCFVRRRLQRLGRAGGPFDTAMPDDDLAVGALAWDD